ncbi:MAG: hypothetical protein AB2693_13430 [Candidatus Thiodiazotropha sp.]
MIGICNVRQRHAAAFNFFAVFIINIGMRTSEQILQILVRLVLLSSLAGVCQICHQTYFLLRLLLWLCGLDFGFPDGLSEIAFVHTTNELPLWGCLIRTSRARQQLRCVTRIFFLNTWTLIRQLTLQILTRLLQERI